MFNRPYVAHVERSGLAAGSALVELETENNLSGGRKSPIHHLDEIGGREGGQEGLHHAKGIT